MNQELEQFKKLTASMYQSLKEDIEMVKPLIETLPEGTNKELAQKQLELFEHFLEHPLFTLIEK